MHGQHREHRLDTPGATEQMACHRFGGIDHNPAGVIAQRQLNGVGLIDITERRGRAVGIDVVDLVGVDAGIDQRGGHGTARSVDVGRRHVVGIGAHTKTGELGVNLGATRLGMLILLEHQHTGTFTKHKAVTVLVPGPGGGLRVIVAGRQGAQRRETAHAQGRYGGLGTAGDHDIAVAVFTHAGRQANCMQAGAAGRDHRDVRALKAMQHGHMARDHVDDRGWHEKG